MGCPSLLTLPLTIFFSFGLSRHFTSEPNPNQTNVSGDILASFQKSQIVTFHDPSKHTYIYMLNIWRADSGKALELITCGLSGQFLFWMKPVPITFILQSDWIAMVDSAMALLNFSNDLTHYQLFVSVPLCQFILWIQVYVVNDCNVCASKSEFTILYCDCKIWQVNALYVSKFQKRLQWI